MNCVNTAHMISRDLEIEARGGAVVARRLHTPQAVGSIPTPAI